MFFSCIFVLKMSTNKWILVTIKDKTLCTAFFSKFLDLYTEYRVFFSFSKGN